MPTLLALHDKDGDETDLPPVLRMIAPGWTILSPRLTWNTEDLLTWLKVNADTPPIAFGYGAGADLAAELLLTVNGALAGGILLRPSEAVPAAYAGIQLDNVHVAVITGGDGECGLLARALSEAGARLDLAVNDAGRSLTPQDFALAKQWLAGL